MPRSAPSRPARRRASSILFALVGVLVLVGPTSAAPPQAETWHRLNPATDEEIPEHEVLTCLPGVQWTCRYDKQPEEGLHWDRTIGVFHGRDIGFTEEDCPEFFPTEICEGIELAIGGWITFALDDGGSLKTGQALLFTDGEGIAPLYVYWFNFGFVCPWYGSFEDALAANPDAELDCIFE